jgi:hypothetical protein
MPIDALAGPASRNAMGRLCPDSPLRRCERLPVRLPLHGESYFREARVEIVSVDASSVRASVAGSETYAIELRNTGGDISGNCTCVAFTEWDFCKHIVAAGLAANALSLTRLPPCRIVSTACTSTSSRGVPERWLT